MRSNSYTTLRKSINDLTHKYFARKKKLMFYYPAKEVMENSVWSLHNLSERVRAAEQLDYEVHLRWTDQGLEVLYVEKFEPKYF